MKFRRARTLAMAHDADRVVYINYANGSEYTGPADLTELLAQLNDWTTEDTIAELMHAAGVYDPAAYIQELIDGSVLIRSGSRACVADVDFGAQWKFGISSAILHMSVLDRAVCPIEEQIEFQKNKAEHVESPPLWRVGCEYDEIRMKDPDTEGGLYVYLEKRRTVRDGVTHSLEFNILSDLLYAGLGVQDFTENAVAQLPLKYAPSGGGRNPFDGYLFAYDVEGLDRGVYRYSGVSHGLERIPVELEDGPDDLLGGQVWAKRASAVLVLVANFERTMWKYEGDDNAYRVVMIEAGHIAQNVMLMAGSLGYSACPSAAIDHSLINGLIDNERFDVSPIYAMAFNLPDGSIASR